MSDTLEERLNEKRSAMEYAETWKPEEHGPQLIGTFEKMDAGSTRYGECEIAHIRTESGELMAAWLFHTVLKNEWEEAAPTPGDRVAIEYLGERDGKSYSYHAYAVARERRSEADSEATADDDAEGRLQPDDGHDKRPDPTMDDPNAELPY